MKHKISKKIFSFWAPWFFLDVPWAKIIHFQIFVNSWYIFSDENKFELPHLIEHCLFEKNSIYWDWFNIKYESEKIWAIINGFTWTYFNYFTISAPLEEYNKMIDILLKLVNNPVFEDEIFNKQKTVITNELEINKNNFQKNLLNDIDILISWWKDSYDSRLKKLNNIKIEDVINYYNSNYHPSNYSFVLCWDLSWIENNVFNKIDSFFENNIKDLNRNKLPILNKNNYKKRVITRDILEKNNYNLVISFIKENMTFGEYIWTLFLGYILFYWMWARIKLKSRELWLSYSPNCTIWMYNWYWEFSIYDSLNEDKIEKYINLVINELKDIINWNVSDKEMERAKWYINWIMRHAYRTEDNIINYYAQRLVSWMDFLNLEEFLEQLQLISKENFIKIIKNTINFDNYVAWIIGKNASLKEEFIRNLI